jgi:hypothetical protein
MLNRRIGKPSLKRSVVKSHRCVLAAVVVLSLGSQARGGTPISRAMPIESITPRGLHLYVPVAAVGRQIGVQVKGAGLRICAATIRNSGKTDKHRDTRGKFTAGKITTLLSKGLLSVNHAFGVE